MEFNKIRIKDIHKTTEDCSIIKLDIPSDLQEKYSYKQGQYLTVRATINGEELIRNYSLCSSPLDKEWKIGVKKIPNGRFSTFANEVLQSGDYLEIGLAEGNFFVDISKNEQKNYIAFAAGSGITPILSIIKTHLSEEPKANFKLFYSNQTVSSIILKEEIEALKNNFMGRFEVFYFLTKENRTIPFLNGRMSVEKMDIIFKAIANIEDIDHFFSCGPQEMILMIRDYLLSKGVDKSKIHFELFHADGAAPETQEKIKKEYRGKSAQVSLREGGKTLNFSMEQGSDNILDAALSNLADLPYACKGGVCCTCKAKLLDGEVKMLLNYGLEDDEVEEGYILTCQSIPVSDTIVVDYDI